MNWKKIKKKYPQSVKLVKEWLHIRPECDIGLWEISKLFKSERKLYDFFDEQGILVSIIKVYLKDVFWFKVN
ncbi:unnamed protein product, partial [marine sediment metagenome]